jgi:hypothetical protein
MTQMFNRLLTADDTHNSNPQDAASQEHGFWETFALHLGRQTTIAHPFSEAELMQTDHMWND